MGLQQIILDDGGASLVPGGGLSGDLDAAFGDVQGSILHRTATAWEALPPGTAGQALTTAGAGANVYWGAGGGGSGGFDYQSTAPLTPSVGNRWVDSDTGIEYTFVDDGSSMQWVEF